jgi:Putative auto-transporter adhesin, head GIN domain/Protein of unknown function (DUF1700)
MSRALFIAKLKEGLAGLSQPDINEIASDYEFHFAEAGANGQSEDDIAARLGDPTRLARELREEVGQGRPGVATQKIADAAPTWLQPLSRFRLILGALIAIGAVVGVYYIVNAHQGSDTIDSLASGAKSAGNITKLSSAPNAVATAPSASKVLISGEQTEDLGLIEQEKLYVVVDGGGHASAHGHVKELTLQIDGSGKADFEALQANNVHVELTGTGDAEVMALQVADVIISGSGTVHLKVKPKLLKQSITGSGQVVFPVSGSQK